MDLFPFPKREGQRSVALKQNFSKMKSLLIVFFCLCFHSAFASPQQITISLKDARLETVFKEIQRQTDYRFVYTKEQLAVSKNVSIQVSKETIETVLRICFSEQPLSYTIEEKFIVVAFKEAFSNRQTDAVKHIDLAGRVVNEQGQGLAGVSVIVQGSNKGAATNASGEFTLHDVEPNATLILTSIGYESQTVRLQGQSSITIQLKQLVASLDETIVIAYGTTTKRLNTGNISKVSSETIEKQPVSNVLAAMEGRVPGLLVTQSNGVPGSSFKIQIRGRNSITQGSEPLIVIDGVPYAANNNYLNQISSTLGADIQGSFNPGGSSPLASINPLDIESIEVLKDADATSIYGSRGANGVILITTKKGKIGKTRINFHGYTGISRITRTTEFLNTAEYFAMRRQAFANDGVTPNSTNAYDLINWDSTRYNDFQKFLIGGTAKTHDIKTSISGGNATVQFLIGAGWHYETTVFPGDLHYKRGNIHFNVTHGSSNKKFSLSFSGNYSIDDNNLSLANPVEGIRLPPNSPSLYDASGNLNWQDGGAAFSNPLAYMFQQYEGKTNNLIGNVQLSYKVLSNLFLKANLGYNNIQFDELAVKPKASLNPLLTSVSSSQIGNRKFDNWIAEPQIEYNRNILKGKLVVLVGGTWLGNQQTRSLLLGEGFQTDNLLRNIATANSITISNSFEQYRYQAVFSRINYNWQNRYILNLTARRDGSSRFGPGRQFANFGSAGASWIFSNEKFIQQEFAFLSFGKLRASYGTSGNDQIGNYQFYDAWVNTTRPYQDNLGLMPARLFNSDYSWEETKKLEIGIELGFLKDRFLLNTSYFRNRSDNQLVNYRLPAITGFTSVLRNFPAIVENKGWEIELNATWYSRNDLRISSFFNITIPENKLLAFPDIESSSYSNYIIGKSLSLIKRYEFLGVDPATGIFIYNDRNGDGVFNSEDYVYSGDLDNKFYGGLRNLISYKGLELDVFCEFRKQTGYNYLYSLTNAPGRLQNYPSYILNNWVKPGDISEIQKFTQSTSSAASSAWTRLLNSNGMYSDASFIRIKNIGLVYKLPDKWMKKLQIDNCRIFC